MHRFDYTVLFLYLGGMLVVGWVFSKHNRSSEDMFAAGGQSPWWVSGLSAYMTMFSAGTFVVWGGIAYERGAVAIGINICYGIAALFVGYFVAARWKTLGVGTPAEFIQRRFGHNVLLFYTWSMLIFRVVGTAVALYALSVILVSLMPLSDANPLQDSTTGNFSVSWAILLFGCIVVIYTMLGGLWAVLMTDVLQFIVLTLAVLLMAPLIWGDVGGWTAFIDQTPVDFLRFVDNDYTLFFLFGWVLIHIFMIGADWAFAQRFISVSSPQAAQKSAYLFGVLYLVSPVFWLLPPMLYRAINPEANAEQAYMLASQSVLPVGMVGLMIAAMFSATASMVSSQLNVFAGVLTKQLYLGLFNPQANDRQQIIAGRWLTVLLGAILIAIALAVPYLGGAETLVVTLGSLLVGPLMAPTIWGMLGRKIRASAVWITALLCFFCSVLVKFGLSEKGWFSGFFWLAPLVEWIQNHGKTTDIIIGVCLPVAILTAMHGLAKNDAPRAIAIDIRPLNKSAKDAPEQMSTCGQLPGKVVAIALHFCALTFMGVALVANEQQGVLWLFSALIITIAVVITLVNRRLARTSKASTAAFSSGLSATHSSGLSATH